jgi:bis(5'-nucleosidyl)-tetraphosphatase
MLREQSYGIIPLHRRKATWDLLLVQLHAGHWGFPKGHLEAGEEPQQTAVRELYEETGLHVKSFLSDKTLEEHYHFTHQGRLIEKRVIYFIADVKGTLKIQEEEIKAAKWVPLDEAEQHVTFAAGKALCGEVRKIMQL